MHAHCFHWLMSTGLFSYHGNPRLVKWRQWRALTWQWGPDIALAVSTCLSSPVGLGLVVEYWPFILWIHACGRHSHSKLYDCVVLFLCFSLCYHLPHPVPLPPIPYIYTGPILMNSMKKSSKTSENQPLSSYLPG